MTTPTINKVEEFRAEMLTKIDQASGNVDTLKEQIGILAAASANLLAEVTAIRNDVQWIVQRTTAALDRFQTASSSQPAKAQKTETILAEAVTYSIDDNGKPAYKIRGGRYAKGIRIWPEVLPLLGIDPDLLVTGLTRITPPLNVLVEIAKRKGRSDLDEDITQEYDYAKKVIGLA